MDENVAASFSQLLGGGLVFFAIVSAALSLCENLRAHTLRLLAIFFVTALALFSGDVTTYFVAIFVIATAVTELEFLQNLAAIIRGNKEYFDYKKEALSKERKMDILAKEAAQSAVVVESSLSASAEKDSDSPSVPEQSSPSPSQSGEQPAPSDGSNDDLSVAAWPTHIEDDSKRLKSNSSGDTLIASITEPPPPQSGGFVKTSGDIRRIYEFEAKAFDSLELLYGKAIERGVRLRGEKSALEVDGLIVNYDGENDMVVEVKFLSSARNFIRWSELIGVQLRKIATHYKQITRKTAVIHFVLILEAGVTLTTRQKDALSNLEVMHVSVFTTDYLEKISV